MRCDDLEERVRLEEVEDTFICRVEEEEEDAGEGGPWQLLLLLLLNINGGLVEEEEVNEQDDRAERDCVSNAREWMAMGHRANSDSVAIMDFLRIVATLLQQCDDVAIIVPHPLLLIRELMIFL